jgi:FkbM family methyltransferase
VSQPVCELTVMDQRLAIPVTNFSEVTCMDTTLGNGGALAGAQQAASFEMYEEPRGRLEKTLAEVWAGVLRHTPLGRNDNFFELGGNSLLGMELMDQVSQRLGLQLPAVMLFQNPSPRQLAECISSLEHAAAADVPLYDELQKLREQQSASDDIEFLLALPLAHAGQLLHQLKKSRAQFRQDLFVLSELQFKRNGFFVEFGATDGVNLSNTWLLEKEFDWTGILAEPARCWHEELIGNRTAHIEPKCVWGETGTLMTFNEVEVAELSTIDSFSAVDFHEKRRLAGHTYEVETICLNDLLEKYQAPRRIDYLSIDTEGSELEILRHFDFGRYQCSVISCEHNFTAARDDIYRLLSGHGYVRKYPEISKVDDWYVMSSTGRVP